MSSNSLLTVDGQVRTPLRLAFDDLSGFAAGDQIVDVSQIEPSRQGTAVRLTALLDRAGVQPDATHLTLHASADDFHASVPIEAVLDRGMLIYRIGDQPLPAANGGPVRFFIRDYASCQADEVDECANVKFVDRIELTVGPGQDNRPQDEDEHSDLHRRQDEDAP